VLTNPYHVDGLTQALEHPIDIPRVERTLRIRSLRRLVCGGNTFRWATPIVGALEYPRHEAGAFGPRRVPAGEPLTLRPVAESASNVCG